MASDGLDFPAWLLAHARPGDDGPVSALTREVCKRSGRRLSRTPAALGRLLRETGASSAVYAAASLAVRQYTTDKAARLTEAAPVTSTDEGLGPHQLHPTILGAPATGADH
jgi:hypothetical protein